MISLKHPGVEKAFLALIARWYVVPTYKFKMWLPNGQEVRTMPQFGTLLQSEPKLNLVTSLKIMIKFKFELKFKFKVENPFKKIKFKFGYWNRALMFFVYNSKLFYYMVFYLL